MVVVVDGSADGYTAAGYAGSLAAGSGSALTVALLLTTPWTLALEPLAMAYHSAGDAEIDMVTRLSRLLDPYGVRWDPQPVTYDPVATIGAAAVRRGADRVVAGRRRTARIARALGRRYALAVLDTPAHLYTLKKDGNHGIH
nr:universal stress protein [Planomonospora venezuelensis]